MFHAFNEAKAITMKRMEDPRIVPLAWYREAWEEQEELLGSDPWEYGLGERNRHTMETLAGYSYEQGLVKRPWPVEELFVELGQGRKRGDRIPHLTPEEALHAQFRRAVVAPFPRNVPE